MSGPNPFSKNTQKDWVAATPTEVLLEYLWNAINEASAAGSSEATLQQILAAIQNGSEFEARLVVDSDAAPVVWLEVRLWDTEAGTWGPISYYLPGSTVAGSPVLPVSYLDPNSILITILAQLVAINGQFTGTVTLPAAVDISLDAAYVIPAGTYNAIQIVVNQGVVTRGDATYDVGVWPIEAPLRRMLPAITLDASGSTDAFVEFMTP